MIINLMPALLILLSGLILGLLPFVRKWQNNDFWVYTNIAVFLIALVLCILYFDKKIVSGIFVFDQLSFISFVVLILLGTICLFNFKAYNYDVDNLEAEKVSLVSFAIFGAMGAVATNDLLILLVALEIFSFSLYGLMALGKQGSKHGEALLKFFVTNSVATALFIFGLSILFLKTASLQLDEIAFYISSQEKGDIGLVVGFIFLLALLLYKVGAFGFYFYSIESYFGAKLPTTSVIASVGKFIAIVIFIRIGYMAFYGLMDYFNGLILVMAVLSMFAGNLLCIKEKNTKKIIVSASVTHAGYLLAGLGSIDTTVALEQQWLNIIYYVSVYALTVCIGFFVLSFIADRNESNLNIDDFTGLIHNTPIVAGVLCIVALSFFGFPLTVGFVAKFNLFSFIYTQGHEIVAFWAIINSILSGYYYLKIVSTTIFNKGRIGVTYSTSLSSRILLVVLGCIVIGFGSGLFSFTHLSYNLKSFLFL